MSEKLKKLKIQKILQEYSFLRIDDEYKKTLREEHIGDFLFIKIKMNRNQNLNQQNLKKRKRLLMIRILVNILN